MTKNEIRPVNANNIEKNEETITIWSINERINLKNQNFNTMKP